MEHALKAKQWKALGYLMSKTSDDSDWPTIPTLAFIKANFKKGYQEITEDLPKAMMDTVTQAILDLDQKTSRVSQAIHPLTLAIIVNDLDQFKELLEPMTKEELDQCCEEKEPLRAVMNCPFVTPYGMAKILGRGKMAQLIETKLKLRPSQIKASSSMFLGELKWIVAGKAAVVST